jgi:hypothetical protein
LLHCQEKTGAKKGAKVAAKLDACGVTAQCKNVTVLFLNRKRHFKPAHTLCTLVNSGQRPIPLFYWQKCRFSQRFLLSEG